MAKENTMGSRSTCVCAKPGVTVEELLACDLHAKGHTIIACQVCYTAVCRLFFKGEPDGGQGKESRG